MGVPLLEPPVTRWECNHCSFRDTTREAGPHSRFHACAGLGMTAPMVQEGSGARLIVHERDDYIGDEDVQLSADGRPIASIQTEHADGHTDCVVFAPTAHAGAGA